MTYKNTQQTLNQLTADLSQASAAIHQIHWYLRGLGFKTFHELMDEYRDQIEDQLDEVAERLIIINGAPVSTLEEFIELTNIPSVTGTYDKSIEDHLERLVMIFQTLIKAYSKGINMAADEEDHVTEDLLIDHKGQLELNLWMMQAELNHAPNRE